MGSVISSLVNTFLDRSGNPQTTGSFLLEFTSAGIPAGGEVFDLSSYFRRIEYAHVTPASGALVYLPSVQGVDWPGSPLSGRITLYRSGGSGLVLSEVASGLAVSGTRCWAYIVGS